MIGAKRTTDAMDLLLLLGAAGGRGAFCSRMKAHRQDALDEAEVRMSERVAINSARNGIAVSLRFPGEG